MRSIGDKGESQAKTYLLENGYTILHTNWHFHHYELDIVATRDDELIVVEVKTRAGDCLLDPEESVDNRKIQRLVSAADAYVRQHAIDLPVRFDIITLIQTANGYRINHIDDAFLPPVKKRKW